MSRYGVWASHQAAQRASGIIVKSENLKQALPKRVDLSKVRIIPNGVSLERFRPMDRQEARQILGWPQDRQVALFVTVRGHPRKHPELAREAIEKVSSTGRQMDLRIMQGVPHDQVPLWLNASDVLLLTSIHEGSVNVVKEAMACNLPVVSVDVGDVRERLEGVRNCAVTEATAESLAAALIEVFDGGQRSNGRDYLGDLTLTATAKRVESLYGYAVERFNRTSLGTGPIANVPAES
jgi:glycosyltransferase involved in cell wall biosynthesis